MWIKICGNTSLADCGLAIEYGADALGFIFAASPRRISPRQAQEMIAHIPPKVETYGVFVNSPLAEIAAIVETCGLTGVQIHRSSDEQLALQLRERFARPGKEHLKIVRVVDGCCAAPGEGARLDESQLEQAVVNCARDTAIDAMMLDSSTANAVGGAGVVFDWERARASISRLAPKVRLIVAGGLHSGNVGDAIAALHPWGVDVVSGVEESPGKKDAARLRAFITAARTAGARPGGGVTTGSAQQRSGGERRTQKKEAAYEGA